MILANIMTLKEFVANEGFSVLPSQFEIQHSECTEDLKRQYVRARVQTAEVTFD
jgi:hypothetical protein